MIKEEMDPNNKHKNDTLRSVQQKCRLSAEVILKEEKNISHYITGKIVKLKSKLLLDRLRYVVEDELDLLEEKKDDGGKEEGSEAASFFTTHVKQIAEKVTGLRNRNHHNATYSAMLQTQEKILTAIQQLQSVEEDGTTQRKDAYGSSNDLRVTYFPQSLLSRLAFTLSISVEDIQNKESNIVRRIWKEIVGQMQTQFEKGKRKVIKKKESKVIND
ncbi:hypothetical protein AGDE_15253 [Angomonas deanei]|uniref:Uncharacterized protein n=1 Tax=Angomonas deanei TaxID=59799 RepID=A0A7G2CCS9_9TRYP|nr:hypothetical protein AGDE_15253 [Angomonas deanei]CAD2217329.1 hypothetical protein, conserved [Angomonas deanei]|eukprot:EPY19414.1 hypothetical protein AGDE_15253 [Angomonas deanei]